MDEFDRQPVPFQRNCPAIPFFINPTPFFSDCLSNQVTTDYQENSSTRQVSIFWQSQHGKFISKLWTMKTVLLLAISLLFINSISAQKKPGKKKYYCAPCGCENDGKTFDEGGKCAICKMGLLEVGTFNFELNDISKNLMLYSSNKKDNKQQLYYKEMNAEKERSLGEGSSAKFSTDGKAVVFMRGESIWIYDIAANKFNDLSTKITKALYFLAGFLPI